MSPTGPESVAAQLRDRREAASRLPPLADGTHDPLDRLAGRKERRFAGLADTGSGRFVFLRCRADIARELFDELGVPMPYWSRAGSGYPVPRDLAGDLLAIAAHSRIHVMLPEQASARRT